MLEERIRQAVESLGRVDAEPPPLEAVRAAGRRRRRLRVGAGLAALLVIAAVVVPLSLTGGSTSSTVQVIGPAPSITVAAGWDLAGAVC